jgi:excisionase family DNA binding protein
MPRDRANPADHADSTTTDDPLSAAFRAVVRQAVRDELADVIEELRALLEATASAKPPAAYKVAEIAERYSIGHKTVYDAIARGDLAARRSGRAIRVTAEAAEAWLGVTPTNGDRP